MLRRNVVFAAIFLAVQTLSFGQSFRGSMAGSVADASGAAVPAAEVKIVNKETGLTRSVQTESAGEFSFPDLVPGIYTVTATKTGFQAYVQDIQVAVGKVASLPITLARISHRKLAKSRPMWHN
jgi:hypothetical protein